MPLKPVLTTPFNVDRLSWRWEDDVTGLEFQVRGTLAGPDAQWLELARQCASEIDGISTAAMKYLRETAPEVPNNLPEVRWLVVGLDDRAEFEWFATVYDDYDLWSVRFRVTQPATFTPAAFSRRQW